MNDELGIRSIELLASYNIAMDTAERLKVDSKSLDIINYMFVNAGKVLRVDKSKIEAMVDMRNLKNFLGLKIKTKNFKEALSFIEKDPKLLNAVIDVSKSLINIGSKRAKEPFTSSEELSELVQLLLAHLVILKLNNSMYLVSKEELSTIKLLTESIKGKQVLKDIVKKIKDLEDNSLVGGLN